MGLNSSGSTQGAGQVTCSQVINQYKEHEKNSLDCRSFLQWRRERVDQIP